MLLLNFVDRLEMKMCWLQQFFQFLDETVFCVVVVDDVGVVHHLVFLLLMMMMQLLLGVVTVVDVDDVGLVVVIVVTSPLDEEVICHLLNFVILLASESLSIKKK